MIAELPGKAGSAYWRPIWILLLALGLAACGDDDPAAQDASYSNLADALTADGWGRGGVNGRDTRSPTVTITAPTSGSSWRTSASSVTIAGTASDDSSVARVTWSTDSGASGVASGTSSWTINDLSLHPGTNTVAITAYDSSGLTGTQQLTVTYESASAEVINNQPPSISGTPPSSVQAGTAYQFKPSATDPEGGSLLFSISNAPGWVRFDVTTGAMSGTPQTGDVGTAGGITISVTDGVNEASLPAFAVTVEPGALNAVTLSWLPPTENVDGSTASDLAGYKIYYGSSAGSYAHSVVVANPGLTSYVVDSLGAGTWHFAMSAFDKAGQESALSAEVTRVL